MDLNNLNEQLQTLLSPFNVKDLPNYPNLQGVFEETDVKFAIVNGQRNRDKKGYLKVFFNVSIAALLRKKSTEDNLTFDETVNLYQLIQTVIEELEKKKVYRGGLIETEGFENFTPESGKWRSLVNFSVDVPISSSAENDCKNIIGIN